VVFSKQDEYIKDTQGAPARKKQTILEDGAKLIIKRMQKFQPDVIICGSRGGAWINELMKQKIQLPATVIINAWGSYSSDVAKSMDIHWDLPLNTPIALIYGENDTSFKYKAEDVRARAKTGSVGLTHTYISDEGHDIRSLWTRDGLPKIIEAAYRRNFSNCK